SRCNVSPLASPSIVVISAPSCIAASIRQALTRLPFNRTVHAPHAPALQPFFVPYEGCRADARPGNAGPSLVPLWPFGASRRRMTWRLFFAVPAHGRKFMHYGPGESSRRERAEAEWPHLAQMSASTAM